MPVDFDKLFRDITKLKVAVIGDVMLDTYWWGNVERISPEGPVPVVAVTKREYRIGGAGNVALNVLSLGCEVSILSIIGDDNEGKQLEQLMTKNGIDTGFLLVSGKRVTTNKIRIISRNQQMMRLDAESTLDIDDTEENKLYRQAETYVNAKKPDVIILQDYNKGILTENFIEKVILLCNKNNIVCAVDPKRKNFFAYKNVTLFKPNLKEVKESLHILSDEINEEKMRELHYGLKEKLSHSISLITLSEKGIFYQHDKESGIIASHLRSIADVSGAGDTVIAVASLIYAATKSVNLMAEIANIAGGLVCEEVGTVAINKEKLVAECKQLLLPAS
jgi:D-glycero-beta-D-manno-heptose-7-phosphate kinase